MSRRRGGSPARVSKAPPRAARTRSDQRRPRLRQAEPHPRLAPRRPQTAPPEGRPGPPGRQQHGQRGQVEPPGLLVGERVADPARGLAPENRLAVGLATGDRRRHGPGQDDPATPEQAQEQAAVPRPGGRPAADRPGRRQQGDRQQVQQRHRPLGEESAAETQGEQQPAGPAVALPGTDQPDAAQQHEERQHQVEHDGGGEVGPGKGRSEHQRRVARGLRAFREQQSGEPRDQKQTAEGEQRHQDPRPPGVHAGQRPPTGDQPEQERGLVAVGLPVQVGDQPVAAQPHLPGHRQVAGLVDGQDRADQARRQVGREQRERGGRRPGVGGHAPTPPPRGTSRTSGRCIRRCSQATPSRSTIPTQSRLCSPYLERPA